MVTSPTPLPPVQSVREVYVRPVMTNGIVMNQEHTVVRHDPVFTQSRPESSNHPQMFMNGVDKSMTVSHSHPAESDDEGGSLEEYAVDNSDVEMRKQEAALTSDVCQLREIAFRALNEIIDLRSELFETQKRSEVKTKVAQKIKQELERLFQA